MDHGSGGHGREQGADTEDDGKPGPLTAQAVLDVIHRSAIDAAIFIGFTILDGEGAFREGEGHAEQGRDPHPEDRARSAHRNCRGDAGKVAGPDLARQGGRQSLPGRDGAVFALRLASLPHFYEGGHKPADGPASKADHQQQAGAKQEDRQRSDLARDNHGVTPGATPDKSGDVLN